jgi:nucleotide-binding universal stress UspA family protein
MSIDHPEEFAMAKKPVVVGVDGSTSSRLALQWAMEWAAANSLPVQVVSTWTAPSVASDPSFVGLRWGESIDRGPATREMVASMVEEFGSKFPEVSISQHVVAGNAAWELIDLSQHAEIVVVGSHGHGGFSGMLIGSVSQHVLAHSHCTVAVVR